MYIRENLYVHSFFYKKPSKRPSPQSFLKKWPLEPSKFLNSFLISRGVFAKIQEKGVVYSYIIDFVAIRTF